MVEAIVVNMHRYIEVAELTLASVPIMMRTPPRKNPGETPQKAELKPAMKV